MVTTGYYVNVFSVNNAGITLTGNERYLYDLYVILNEPNDPPTPEEVTAIGEAIDAIHHSLVKDRAYEAVEKLNLNCTKFGFRIVDGEEE